MFSTVTVPLVFDNPSSNPYFHDTSRPLGFRRIRSIVALHCDVLPITILQRGFGALLELFYYLWPILSPLSSAAVRMRFDYGASISGSSSSVSSRFISQLHAITSLYGQNVGCRGSKRR
jgi:hypothetical protein